MVNPSSRKTTSSACAEKAARVARATSLPTHNERSYLFRPASRGQISNAHDPSTSTCLVKQVSHGRRQVPSGCGQLGFECCPREGTVKVGDDVATCAQNQRRITGLYPVIRAHSKPSGSLQLTVVCCVHCVDTPRWSQSLAVVIGGWASCCAPYASSKFESNDNATLEGRAKRNAHAVDN